MVNEEKKIEKAGKKVIVWGDSIARGVIFDEEKGRYAISKDNAANIIAQKLNIEILNRSRMGLTVSGGLDIIKRDLENGIVADAAVIEFGGNDCDFNWREVSEAPDISHDPKTPADEFETKLKDAIMEVKAAGITPILVNLPPIDADQYFEFISKDGLSQDNILKWLGDKYHIYRFHERYSMIITRIAKECSCRLLDVRSAFLNLWSHKELICRDGIHPSVRGQALISEAIIAEL